MAEDVENPLPLPAGTVEDESDIATSPVVKKSKLDGARQPGDCTPATPVTPAGRESDIEVELVQSDESDFLDGAIRLASLQTDLEDVRNRLMLRRNQAQYVPFQLFRHWCHRVLSVSDLSRGVWCEVQTEYHYLHPHLKTSKEWTQLAEKGTPVLLKTESMKKGSAVHMKKELEVHDIVKVDSITKEDRMAVQLVNTYNQLAIIKTGKIERELSVFGDPFDQGILVRGVIDQLQYIPENGELILMDNKTRKTKRLPGTEQKRGIRLQLMLYKHMLDNMCLGITKSELLCKHLRLDRDADLTTGPLDYIHNCGLGSLFRGTGGVSNSGCSPTSTPLKFGVLADCILQHIAGLGLPMVGSLMVQYEHQESGETLGVDQVEYDENWAKAEVRKGLGFWSGERAARGVDIEDAWKCETCQFRDICVWRLRQKLEASPAAKLTDL